MDEIDESNDYHSLFDNNCILSKTDWESALSDSTSAKKWKEMDCDTIKIHMNKAKDEMLDQLDKEICAVRKMVENKIGPQESYSVEEISKMHFGDTGVVHKYFLQNEVSHLSNYESFAKFIGTYFLLARTSLLAANLLINKENNLFCDPDLVNRAMRYDDYAKSWREIGSHGLPKIGTLNIDMNRFPWVQLLWQGLEDVLSAFTSKLFLKHWNVNRDKLHVCIDDDKFHLSILQGTDNLKLSRHVRDNRNGLTNHVLAASGLGLKLATEYEKFDDNAVSTTKNLIEKQK